MANALFDAAASSEEEQARNQRVIRRAFVAMVQLGEGTPDTRRVVGLSELVTANDTPVHVREVLAPFTAPEARLISASDHDGQTTYELTHEALITSWDRLRAWLGSVPDKVESERIRGDLRLYRRLSAAAADWKFRRGGLWGPVDLGQLTEYLTRNDDELTEAQIALATASRRQVRRQWWITRTAAAAIAFLAVAATGLAWVSEQRKQEAIANEKRAIDSLTLAGDELGRRLVERGEQRLTDRPELSVRYAEAASKLNTDLAPAALLKAAAEAVPVWRRLPDPRAYDDSPSLYVEDAGSDDVIAVDPELTLLLVQVPHGNSASETDSSKIRLGLYSIQSGELLDSRELKDNEHFLTQDPLPCHLFAVKSGDVDDAAAPDFWTAG